MRTSEGGNVASSIIPRSNNIPLSVKEMRRAPESEGESNSGGQSRRHGAAESSQSN
jgi:hypothetical protein